MSGISGRLTPYQPISEILAEVREFAKRGANSLVVRRNLRWLIQGCVHYRNDFQHAGLRLRKSRNLSEADADILHRLYDSTRFKGQDQARAFGALKACPYCGISNPLTLDHYLPRNTSDFPHFSFAAFNLVPACSSCQTAKGTFHPGKSVRYPLFLKKDCPKRRSARRAVKRRPGVRFRILNTSRLIHPYFDFDIDPEEVMLGFEVHPTEGPYNAKLFYRNRRMTPEAALFRNHVKQLEIEQRMQGFVRSYWTELEVTLRRTGVAADTSSISLAVRNIGIHHESHDGAGSLSAVFYRCLSRSTECLEIMAGKLLASSPTLVRLT